MDREGQAQRRKSRLRVIRSSSFGGWMFDSFTLILVLPVFGMTTLMAALTTLPIEWCLDIAGALVVTLLFLAPRENAKSRDRFVNRSAIV